MPAARERRPHATAAEEAAAPRSESRATAVAMDARAVLALQRTAGNQAVRGLLAAGPARPAAALLQRYKETGPDDDFWKLSSDESLGIPMESNLGSKQLWGQPAQTAATVGAANTALQQANSPLRLNWDNTTTKQYTWEEAAAPVAKSKKRKTITRNVNFTRILPQHTTRNEAGDTMTLPKDCGENTREVLGLAGTVVHYTNAAGNATSMAAGYPLLAVARLVANFHQTQTTQINALVRAWLADLSDQNAERALDTLLAGILSGMSNAQREAFEEDAKINAHAVPAVAQGVVIVGVGPKNPQASTRWFFHQAPVVIKSADASDYVTIENFNTQGGPARNTDWAFNMYGTQEGQTIHDEQALPTNAAGQPTGDFGTNPTTFVTGH